MHHPLALATLATIATVLAGTIAWQLRASHGAAEPVPTPRPATAAQAPAPDLTPEMARLSLARPLFAPGRRPQTPATTTAEPAAAATPLPRLTATLIAPGMRSAIFAGQNQPLVVQVGARVGAFEIRAIEPGQVTLAGPGGLRTLRPSFDGSRPAPAPILAATERPLAFTPAPAPPPAIGPGSPIPTLDRAFPPPGPFPPNPNGTQGPMPFDQNPAPSGLDILRNPARP